MRLIVSTHNNTASRLSGKHQEMYNEEIDYVVVHDMDDGEYAIMQDHIPVVSVLEEGYIKLVKDKQELYIEVVYGVLEYHDNVVTVLAQEAHAGRSPESAKEHLLAYRKERLEKNRKDVASFTKMEKDLSKNIKKSKAGRL